jgi:uncharacterized SAM-binding protein YcdF (DUF218 family)
MTPLALVVLGAPNDAQGVLSSLARERCDQALQMFAQHPEARVIPTGGWGPHFNTAPLPHGHYVRAYLEAHGVPAAAFLDVVESRNTVEDARLCRPVVAAHGIRRLIVVTSDFHLPRAQFLFSREFPDLSLEFSAAPTDLPEAELAARIAHEQGALARLRA